MLNVCMGNLLFHWSQAGLWEKNITYIQFQENIKLRISRITKLSNEEYCIILKKYFKIQKQLPQRIATLKWPTTKVQVATCHYNQLKRGKKIIPSLRDDFNSVEIPLKLDSNIIQYAWSPLVSETKPGQAW